MQPVENEPLSRSVAREVSSKDESEEPMLYCPVCNQKLAARHCKLVCERCGYYMSCADYY
jgi:hypothetical protein